MPETVAGRTDGEKIQWTGDIFSELCEKSVPTFGYKVLLARGRGKDLLCLPILDGELVPPLFAPRGKTAFDFTTAGNSLDRKVGELKGKVPSGDQTNGAILIVNSKLPTSFLESALKSAPIYCWDERTFAFYSARSAIHKILSASGTTKEFLCGGLVTYLRSIVRLDKSAYEVTCILLFHDPLGEVGQEELRNALVAIKNDLISGGIYPAKVQVTVMTRAYYRKDFLSSFPKILVEIGDESGNKLAFITSQEGYFLDFFSSSVAFSLAVTLGNKFV